MKLELKIMHALCETDSFNINGIEADYNDFGSKGDAEPEKAEPYGCGNMKFTGEPSKPEVLKKYSISEKEYREICDKLEEGLSFGSCDWCE